MGAEHPWRQQVNDLADKLCGEKAVSEAAQWLPPTPSNRPMHPGWGHTEWEGWQQWGDEHWLGQWFLSWWQPSHDWEQNQASGGDSRPGARGPG